MMRTLMGDGLFSIPESAMTKPDRRSPVVAMRRHLDSLPPEPPSLRQEIADRRFWGALATELLGTLLLTVLGSGAEADSAGALHGALSLGLAVVVLVRCLGGASGAHLNPAVSAALWASGHVGPARATAYVLAQCGGALAGATILRGLSRSGAMVPSTGAAQAFGFEFLSSAVVVLTFLAVAEPSRGGEQAEPLGARGLSIGAAYAVGHLLAFPYTGAALNPARAFGPAIVTNTWDMHWVYWVGPLLGGLFAGFTHDYIRGLRTRTVQRPALSKQPPEKGILSRDASTLSGNDTEMTLDHCRI